MRNLVVIEFLTVDGVMQGLGSREEDTDGGFVHGGWGAPYGPAIHEAVADAGPSHTSSFPFGRRTYEKMAAFWPYQPDTDPMAGQLNRLPQAMLPPAPSPISSGTERRSSTASSLERSAH